MFNRGAFFGSFGKAAYTSTIAVTGTGPVNLRTLANADGYDGLNDAVLTFNLGAAITLTGPSGSGGASNGADGIGGTDVIDSGIWPAGFNIDITLNIDGDAVAGGAGGGAGGGALFNSDGGDGGDGGDAIVFDASANIDTMVVNVNSGGLLQAGGGGGGGGGGGNTGLPEPLEHPGGGGGGGAPTGGGGVKGSGLGGSNGDDATTTTGGAGGSGGGGVGGAGGPGGNIAVLGNSGLNGANAGAGTGGSGGAAGFAVRKNGNTVTVNNNGGTITGTVG